MKRKICLFIVTIAIILLAFSSKIYAATQPPLLPYDLIWNIESYRYYVDSSASGYTTPIANAANNWVYTGCGYNRLYPNTQTTNITNSAVDIYGYSANDGRNAYTSFFARTNGYTGNAYSVSPYSHNWLYNEIKLNTASISSYSSNLKQGVVAHEFGHAFGLDENNTNTQSIMCQMGAGRAVYTVQQVDNNSFNAKHP